MIYLIIPIIIFLILAYLPIAFSVTILKNKKSDELIIPNLEVESIDYFSDLYKGSFLNKWENRKEGNVFLSGYKDSEIILEADKIDKYPDVCESMVYAENKDFKPTKGVKFTKEIYANQNAHLEGVKSLIGLYGKKNIYIGKGTDIVSWLDAEGDIYIDRDCNLGLDTASRSKISLGCNTVFNKLLAPVILLNCDDEYVEKEDTQKDYIFDDFNKSEILRNVKYVDEEETSEDGVIRKSIISKYDIEIVKGMIIKGDVRSNGKIKIGDDVLIYGNVFAEGNIYMGKNSKILGNIFTQSDFIAEENIVIGQKNKIKSLITRDSVVIGKNCIVYGYIEANDIGEVKENW